jgi:hypothetical protein
LLVFRDFVGFVSVMACKRSGVRLSYAPPGFV